MRAFVIACAALTACSAADPHFSKDFLFGTAIAGFQADMGCPTAPRAQCEDPASDWYQWITNPNLLADSSTHLNGDPPAAGPGFYELYPQDLDRAANELHSNALRLSIEWSRVFPTSTVGIEGNAALAAAANPAALAYYHSLFAAIHARGMKALVTLNHYTLPLWIHDGAACHADIVHCTARGWVAGDSMVHEIAKYAGFAAHEFGSEVDLWATLNEPFTAVILSGYVLPSPDRTNPPGVTLRWAEAKAALAAMMQAHAQMADAVHASSPGAKVGIVYNLQAVSPRDPTSARDQQAAKDLSYLMNSLFLNGALKGDFDTNLDGTKVHHDGYAGHTDFLGINYYERVTVSGSAQPLFPQEAPKITFDPFTLDLHGDSAGLSEVLQLAQGYGLPIYITETGMGDASDSGAGAAWIKDTLSRARSAISAGIPVRGYFYWTLMDNYEWNHGMDYKFGLYAVDKNDPQKRRTPRPNAIAAFAKVAQSRLAN